MKHVNSLAVAAIFFCGITSCGNNNSKTNHSDSDLTKIDTTLDPADHTNDAMISDSTQPQGAIGLDTVAGGKSTSSGRKDTTRHK